MIGKYVIVRTYSAGVHFGILREFAGTAVMLTASEKEDEPECTGAKRLWQWTEANTLHEISLRGVGEGSKISEPIPQICLTEAIEVIPVTEVARTNLERHRWN